MEGFFSLCVSLCRNQSKRVMGGLAVTKGQEQRAKLAWMDGRMDGPIASKRKRGR